jgi:hypothetical protein
MSTPDDIAFRLRQLGFTAAAMKPHRVGYLKGFEPDRDDARDFRDDLCIIAGKVDAVFEAYGGYLESLGIISAVDKRVYFTRVVMDAIEGNALFAIEDGIQTRIEEIAHA